MQTSQAEWVQFNDMIFLRKNSLVIKQTRVKSRISVRQTIPKGHSASPENTKANSMLSTWDLKVKQETGENTQFSCAMGDYGQHF